MEIKIIRKIDELGRIVIPKDIREMLSFQIRDNVEITVQSNAIILKKAE